VKILIVLKVDFQIINWIDSAAAIIDLMMELRLEGFAQGGPGQFSLTDRQRFASSLESMLNSSSTAHFC